MSEQQSEIERLLVEREKLQQLQRQLSRVYSQMPASANSTVSQENRQCCVS